MKDTIYEEEDEPLYVEFIKDQWNIQEFIVIRQ